ncbi:response regulator [Dactylosporangium aurantiacum]|uniref:Response regulator n=1 Tax=Dactylosporangium aurantiacum TaxID=35754 RepID=A0A9Q9IP56_9ACTN|nr:response regulator [Dactylosporangium aurantiacum]MDG6110397.1 response regulator [Dactylosporangium aurantiacum]UWZ58608.1 response regulator [Dactylosporangium aurantiacum]
MPGSLVGAGFNLHTEGTDMTGGPLEPAHILLVEDDAGDVALTLDELQEARLGNRITVLGNGLHAIDYLERRGPYRDATTPDILLLDLRLPGVDGRVVLDRVRINPGLANLTVVVLTASRVEEQILRDFGVPAQFYLQKPVDFRQLVALIRSIDGLGLAVHRERP